MREIATPLDVEDVGRRLATLRLQAANAGDDEIRAVAEEALEELALSVEALRLAEYDQKASSTNWRMAEEWLAVLSTELEARATETRATAAEFELLKSVVEHIPAGLVIVDPDGVPVLVNERVREILGIEVEPGRPFAAESWPAVLSPDGRRFDHEELPLWRALESGEVIDAEPFELAHPDGRRASVEVSATPLRARNGALLGAVTTFHDVTGRRLAEQAEREFVENASHELRTPLAAIAGAVEALQLGARDIPEQRDLFLGHIERECERLTRLGTALLTLARVQSGVEGARLEPVELRPMLELLAGELRPASGVVVRVSCRAGLAALSNRELLWHALANLGTNAARYTERGSIDLRARRTGARTLVLEIADTGSGIREQDQARVLRRFQRGPGQRDGFGLGLAIAAQAAEAGGGRLELHSVEGGGTVARVRLRAVQVFVPRESP